MSTPIILKETIIHHQKSIGAVLQMARTITFFCGAGVSTSAGIPDFRSPGGLYAQSFVLGGVELRGDQLFDVSSLQSSQKLALMNQEMAKIRLKSREASIPKFQAWVALLNKQGRLRRCYTQNFDGLQLRAERAMATKVYEVHGSNQRLRCHTCSYLCARPIEDFDHILSTQGLAQCTNCQAIAEKASASNKRPRPIGYLVPDVLFNQQTHDISLENKGWDLQLDTEVDLFIIAGTTLKTEGTLKLVKAMAQNVHHHGGVVIYVDRGGLSKRLSTFVDVHFRMDVDIFSEYFDKYSAKGTIGDRASFREQVTIVSQVSVDPSKEPNILQMITLAERLSAVTPPRLALPLTIESHGNASSDRRELGSPTTIKFILLHTARNEMEADAYGQIVMNGLYRKGYQAELLQQCIGSFGHIPVINPQGSHVLVAFLTSSIVLNNALPAGQDMEVTEMLYFTRRMIQPQGGELSVKIVAFGHYDAFKHLTLAQRLEHEVRGGFVWSPTLG
ncbi:hypothetical protein FRC11_008067 [Ceratobasidium sp. 423]|nr:hypothetical protein FRC11_008067 [Ceratobasidium sp. 423]